MDVKNKNKKQYLTTDHDQLRERERERERERNRCCRSQPADGHRYYRFAPQPAMPAPAADVHRYDRTTASLQTSTGSPRSKASLQTGTATIALQPACRRAPVRHAASLQTGTGAPQPACRRAPGLPRSQPADGHRYDRLSASMQTGMPTPLRSTHSPEPRHR